MPMDWKEISNDILHKIKAFTMDTDGWKISKKTSEVNVWEKQSPEFNGLLYKTEGIIYATPEDVFSFVDPNPGGPRSQWDKAIKELQLVDKIDQDTSIMRTITHTAFGGLISSRDFTDLIVNVNNQESISTNARGVCHPSCPPCSDFVRGTNYTCAIICYRIPGEANKTKLTNYIQTELSGYLPRSLVENALPSNQVDFFASLKKVLQESGKWKGPETIR